MSQLRLKGVSQLDKLDRGKALPHWHCRIGSAKQPGGNIPDVSKEAC